MTKTILVLFVIGNFFSKAQFNENFLALECKKIESIATGAQMCIFNESIVINRNDMLLRDPADDKITWLQFNDLKFDSSNGNTLLFST